MNHRENHVAAYVLFLFASVVFAVLMVRLGVADMLLDIVGGGIAGSVAAGVLFTSMFTVAPAIVVLAELAQNNPLWIVAAFGGAGAMLGDYILFLFVRDRIAEDVAFFTRNRQKSKWLALFRTRLAYTLTPLLGALIIASPWPDEMGLTMLGLSKIRSKWFMPISFFMNALGILAIGFASRALL